MVLRTHTFFADVLLDWYAVGTVPQCKAIQKLLGQYWTRYILSILTMSQQPTAAGGKSGVKRENTSTAGINMQD
jgi:hypothetical protein